MIKDIKEHKQKDAIFLRNYCIRIIKDKTQETKNKNDAAKILARMQHLVQPEKITQKVTSKKEQIKEQELTPNEEKMLEKLLTHGE